MSAGYLLMQVNQQTLLTTQIAPSIVSKFFKKEIIHECYADVNEDVSYAEDLICWISIIMMQCRVSLIEEAFYHYRVREESISHIRNAGTLRKEFLLCENAREVLTKKWMLNDYMSEYCAFVKEHLLVAFQKDSDNDFSIQKYVFPNPEILQHKKIVIMGAGKVGKDFYSQICRYNNCHVVAWIHNYPENYYYEYIDVKSPEVIRNIEFDIIVIATLKKQTSEELRESLICYNIPDDKMVWIKPIRDV